MDRIQQIKEILLELDKQDISYCLLRNYNFLVEKRELLSPSERSIDLVVSRKDFPFFDRILRKHNFLTRKPSFSRKHHAYFRIQDLECISFDVQVGGVHWNDMCYLDETYLLQNRVQKSFFCVPSDNDMVVMLLVHSILGKRYFKSEYQNIISSLIPDTNKEYILERLSESFNRKIGRKIFDSALKGNFAAILQRKYYYLSYFILKSSSNTITFTTLFFRWIQWKKFLKPYPLIAVIGPDGAGKSTVVDALAKHLRGYDRNVSVVYTGRGRDHILPISAVGRAYKRKEKKKDQAFSKKQAGSGRKMLYTLSAPFFTVDLLLRYLLVIMPKRRRKSIVITDRYCSDIILMNNVPLWFKKILLLPFPKPTLTFYLYNSPETLYQRRPEESIAGLKTQMFFFEKLNTSLKPISLLTTDKDKDLEFVVKEVMTYLYKNWY